MIRNYPIRLSRPSWRVKFFAKHVCDQRCKVRIVPCGESPLTYMMAPNPLWREGGCTKKGDLERGMIHLSVFDKDNPQTIYGPLENPDELVVPDKRISVIIDYPLLNRAEAVITSDDDKGFTLKELIHKIKQIYSYIYNEEERTANPCTYHLSKFCIDCITATTEKELVHVAPPEDDCIICMGSFASDSCSKMSCGHVFHKSCITDWMKFSTSCPLCRKTARECNKCNGTYIIYYSYTGVVIPIEERGVILARNMTDGVFGIHSQDFENIYLRSMDYDRKRKQLRLEILD